jgi:hypothetical protein
VTPMRFDEFAKAYRAAHSSELDAPALLHRIQGTLSRRDDRRWLPRWTTWLWSMGLTTALGASLAYALVWTSNSRPPRRSSGLGRQLWECRLLPLCRRCP